MSQAGSTVAFLKNQKATKLVSHIWKVVLLNDQSKINSQVSSGKVGCSYMADCWFPLLGFGFSCCLLLCHVYICISAIWTYNTFLSLVDFVSLRIKSYVNFHDVKVNVGAEFIILCISVMCMHMCVNKLTTFLIFYSLFMAKPKILKSSCSSAIL